MARPAPVKHLTTTPVKATKLEVKDLPQIEESTPGTKIEKLATVNAVAGAVQSRPSNNSIFQAQDRVDQLMKKFESATNLADKAATQQILESAQNTFLDLVTKRLGSADPKNPSVSDLILVSKIQDTLENIENTKRDAAKLQPIQLTIKPIIEKLNAAKKKNERLDIDFLHLLLAIEHANTKMEFDQAAQADAILSGLREQTKDSIEEIFGGPLMSATGSNELSSYGLDRKTTSNRSMAVRVNAGIGRHLSVGSDRSTVHERSPNGNARTFEDLMRILDALRAENVAPAAEHPNIKAVSAKDVPILVAPQSEVSKPGTITVTAA